MHDELIHCNFWIKKYISARDQMLHLIGNESEDFRLILNLAAELVIERGADKRRENLLTVDKMAIIIPDTWNKSSVRDIILGIKDPEGLSARRGSIDASHALYMPLHYVLLFPRGELG